MKCTGMRCSNSAPTIITDNFNRPEIGTFIFKQIENEENNSNNLRGSK